MKSNRPTILLGALLSVLIWPASVAADFTHQPPGQLVSGSGSGRADNTVYVPNMRFPIEQAPAYANSQVYGRGGLHGGGGGQCDSQNYSYPWWDNYCETRTWDMPMCPSGSGHQGQDIRPATCENKKHWAVAAEDGRITNIGTYSVSLVANNGTLHRYLHMDPATLAVSVNQAVSKGQRMGLVSNAFGGSSTTIHLHYDIRQNVSGVGATYVPTYMSLVRSYQDLIGRPAEPCGTMAAEGGIIDDDHACFFLLGNVSTWRQVNNAGHGGGLRWTFAYDGAQPDGYARWELNMAQAGKYRVEVHMASQYAKSKLARYAVRSSAQQADVRLDQTSAEGWRTLGEYDFADGADQWVELYDNTGEPLSAKLELMVDALRLSRIVPPTPDPDPEPDPDPDPDPVDPNPDVEPDAGLGPDVEVPGLPDIDDRIIDEPSGEATTSESSSCACTSVTTGSPRLPIAPLLFFGLVVSAISWRSRRRR
ncbi:MAG: peptidoglycan DD-metalloendopeptidase family protein [Bradymonadaceae bacterium]|nr:peptidoglycan DD-metalloendopeptidase family protein [Lujinxingiaceae bacterium]